MREGQLRRYIVPYITSMGRIPRSWTLDDPVDKVTGKGLSRAKKGTITIILICVLLSKRIVWVVRDMEMAVAKMRVWGLARLGVWCGRIFKE
jgi:hypothetical protein